MRGHLVGRLVGRRLVALVEPRKKFLIVHVVWIGGDERAVVVANDEIWIDRVEREIPNLSVGHRQSSAVADAR